MVAQLIDAQLRAANTQGYTIEKVYVGGWYKKDLIDDVIQQADAKVSAVTEIYGVPVVEVEAEVFRMQFVELKEEDV